MARVVKQDIIDIGHRIRAIRETKKISVTDLSGRTGISIRNLQLIEEGEISADISTIINIADALNVALNVIQPQKLDKYSNRTTSADITFSGGFAQEEASDFSLSQALEEKIKFDQIFCNPNNSLSECLQLFLAEKGWNDAETFWDHTLLHRNYFIKIRNNQFNNVKKNTLLALCIGLGLPIRAVEKVFDKAGLKLQEHRTPDCKYLLLMEYKPGLTLDNFNSYLVKEKMPLLGTQDRAS